MRCYRDFGESPCYGTRTASGQRDAPGFIETPGTGEIPAKRRTAWDRVTSEQPVRRLGQVEEIAEGLLFLMDNEYATGVVLDIDGGYRLT